TNYDDVSDLNGAATNAVLTAAENTTPYVPFIKNEVLAANNKTSPLISQKHPEHLYNSKLTEKYLITTNYDDVSNLCGIATNADEIAVSYVPFINMVKIL
ncbi:2543_t:CDS:1, partial [Racocetra persica]